MPDGRDRSTRSTLDVIEDHLRCRSQGDLEADLRRNYTPDVVLLSAEGVHRGHGPGRILHDRADSFVVERGQIMAPDHPLLQPQVRLLGSRGGRWTFR